MYHRIIDALRATSLRLQSPAIAACVAGLVVLPTLFSGFLLDDYLHLATLDGKGYGASAFDLFIFASGDTEKTQDLIRSGAYPWYTLPELKIHFFRPLSSALMWLDHALFGRTAVLHHLHSIAWYMVLVFAVALLYRRSFAPPVAGLAVLLYLLDDGHIGPVQWLSNRNALVSAAPALLGLVAHIRWREEQWRPGLPLSLLGYGFGLLGGETALGIFGFLAAYEAFGRRDAAAARARAIAPAALLAAIYVAAYKVGGYGVTGSGAYLDPAADGSIFLARAPGRFLDLVSVQFFKLPVELSSLTDHALAGVLFRGATLVIAGVLMIGTRQVWRRLAPEERRALAWLGAGSVAAAIPALAALPAARLLTLAALGAFPIIATMIYHGAGMARENAGALLRGTARVFIGLHVFFPPVMWLGRAAAVPLFLDLSADAFRVSGVDGDALARRSVFTLAAADLYTGFYTGVMRRELGLAPAASWHTLSQAPYAHEITRTGPRQFEVRVLDGEMLSTPVECLLRSELYPLVPGDSVDLGDCKIEVLETGDCGPTHFTVTCARPLESPEYVFLRWKNGQLKPFSWPGQGESVLLSPEDGYFAWPHLKKVLMTEIHDTSTSPTAIAPGQSIAADVRPNPVRRAEP